MTQTTSTAAESGVDPEPEDFREAISTRLEAFIDARAADLAPIGMDLDPLLAAARDATRGGKRLRPIFCYWGWRAAGGSASKTQALTTAAAALELVHAGALTHDDVIDASDYRRGRPASHRRFAEQAGTATGRAAGGRGVLDADRFGQNAAICLGDLLLVWSAQLLAEADFRPAVLARARSYFDRLRSEVVSGQFLDVLGQANPRTGAADAMRVVRYKSARYTVERPLQIGAACAKGSDRLLAALSSYGVPLGEAFQLRDDVLAVFGEPVHTGKPTGDDIREGKPTLLITRAFDQASAPQRRTLEAAWGNTAVSTKQLDDVRQILRETGALDAVETVIEELSSAARSALAHAPLESDETRQALSLLIERVSHRSS